MKSNNPILLRRKLYEVLENEQKKKNKIGKYSTKLFGGEINAIYV